MTLQQQLDAANAAYHALMLGESVREIVDQNGERITYTAANRDALKSYILELETKINSATSGVARSRRPMSVFL